MGCGRTKEKGWKEKLTLLVYEERDRCNGEMRSNENLDSAEIWLGIQAQIGLVICFVCIYGGFIPGKVAARVVFFAGLHLTVTHTVPHTPPCRPRSLIPP